MDLIYTLMKIFDFVPLPAGQMLLLLTSERCLCNSFMIHKSLFTHNKHSEFYVHCLGKTYF